MMMTSDMTALRQAALDRHRTWKTDIYTADLIASNEWEIMWPDDVVEESKPLVENLYLQTLEDKVATAGAMLPQLFVPPRRGTREDRAERDAQRRKRAYLGYIDRSRLRRDLKKWYMDWFHTGATYSMPWCNWSTIGPDGTRTQNPPQQRFAFFQKLNTRQVFPIGHNAAGDLTSVLIMRQKRVDEMVAEWGEDNPGLRTILAHRQSLGWDMSRWLDEIWFMDEHHWAVAVVDSMLPNHLQGSAFVLAEDANHANQAAGPVSYFLHNPEQHRLGGCPISESRRVTHNDRYIGALWDIIPSLRVAQNFMARLLDDLEANIYAPTVLDNIENAHEYGLGAVLRGNGQGQAAISKARQDVNFEAQQTVRQIMSDARKQAFEPPQRSGEVGASIGSGKLINAVQGTFNAELAWAQTDFEFLLERTLSVTARFDEVWCEGLKEIEGFDDQGREYHERYDPAKVFAGDYRNKVTYGDRTGFDDVNHLTRWATLKQLGATTTRELITQVAHTDDALQMEREIAIEKLAMLFIDGVLPQTVQQGDLGALKAFVEKIDDDKETVRSAVLGTIRELESVPAEGSQQGQGGGGSQARQDVMRMVRSLGAGGVPGNAEGQPQTAIAGRELRAITGGQ